MRLNQPNENESDKNFFLSLKNVEDLPDDLLKMVSAQAATMSKSLERQAVAASKQQEEDGMPVDPLATTLMPFVMELSYLKLQLAAVSSHIEDLTKNG